LEDADEFAGPWIYETVVVENPDGLLATQNPWIYQSKRWDVAFLLIDEQRIVRVKFEPFDISDSRVGIKPLSEQSDQLAWREILDTRERDDFEALVRRVTRG
jgi:hypothetical protein